MATVMEEGKALQRGAKNSKGSLFWGAGYDCRGKRLPGVWRTESGKVEVCCDGETPCFAVSMPALSEKMLEILSEHPPITQDALQLGPGHG